MAREQEVSSFQSAVLRRGAGLIAAYAYVIFSQKMWEIYSYTVVSKDETATTSSYLPPGLM